MFFFFNFTIVILLLHDVIDNKRIIKDNDWTRISFISCALFWLLCVWTIISDNHIYIAANQIMWLVNNPESDADKDFYNSVNRIACGKGVAQWNRLCGRRKSVDELPRRAANRFVRKVVHLSLGIALKLRKSRSYKRTNCYV